jgi:hypothetical protein
MKEPNHEEIEKILKKAFPPVDTELRRDLWPAMLRKLDERKAAVPWYDWALLGLLAGTLAAFPELILVFAYHL